jgi:hypothetical protein
MKFPLIGRKKKPRFPGDEKQLAEMYEYEWESKSAEEHAARNRVWEFSLDGYSYKNKKMEKWLERLGEIVRSPELLEECRKKYLSPEEFEQYTQSQAKLYEELGIQNQTAQVNPCNPPENPRTT